MGILGQKKRHGYNRAMPIRQSGAWVGGENAPDIYIIDPHPENL